MIEFLAVIFTLLCVWLTTKRHIMSWPIGLFGIAFYMLVFWKTKLYSDFGLQFIFFVQSLAGLWIWIKNREDKVHTKVETLTHPERLFWLFTGAVSYVGISALMDRYTDAAVPWIDSFVAVFSLIANWLLAKRKIESWVIWIGVDLIYINLFIFKELYWSAGLYGILLLLAIKGLRDWKKCLAV
jgi:nicotinamide mononucleotide transporter